MTDESVITLCKVLIADDSDVMRPAICKALEEETGIDIVGEAGELWPNHAASQCFEAGHITPSTL